MRQLLREKGMLFLVLILFYILLQAILFAWLRFSILPEYFFIDLLLIVALSSVILLIKSNKWVIVYLSVIYALALFMFLINATMDKVYHDVFTLQQLQLAGEATKVFEWSFLSYKSIIVGTLLSILYVFAMVYTNRRIQMRHIEMPQYYKRAGIMFVVLVLALFTIFESKIGAIDHYDSLTSITTLKRASLQKYGMIAYYAKEAENIIQLDNETTMDQSELADYDSVPTDYFGLLKGMNVVEIMIETGQSLAINEELTPNLYMLSHDGITFTNEYSENKTDVSEMIGITGSYPTVYFNPDKYDYDMSFSLPNRLNDTYDTSYYHNNVGTFYERGALMPELGFEHVYLHEQMYPDVPIYDWDGAYPLDSDTVDKIIPHISSSTEPFYAYWTTLSSHGPYYAFGTKDSETTPNTQVFKDLGFWDRVVQAENDGTWVNPVADSTELNINRLRFYECTIMDLDVAVGKLIDALKANNEFDNTLFVFYGDHNIYYHDLQYDIYNTTLEEYYKMIMYKAAFFMYNPLLNETYRQNNDTDSGLIDKFVSPYNIVPTILDLLGMQYNTKIYLADSVFADTDDVFYSNKIAGLFNQDFYSNDGKSVIYHTETADLDKQDQFLSDCQIILDKIDYINKVYSGIATEK